MLLLKVVFLGFFQRFFSWAACEFKSLSGIQQKVVWWVLLEQQASRGRVLPGQQFIGLAHAIASKPAPTGRAQTL